MRRTSSATHVPRIPTAKQNGAQKGVKIFQRDHLGEPRTHGGLLGVRVSPGRAVEYVGASLGNFAAIANRILGANRCREEKKHPIRIVRMIV